MKQPIPYSTRPRLVLVYVSSQAVKSRSPVVEVDGSVREFLRRLGVDQGGREHALLSKQIQALAACHMSLGFNSETIDAKPIERFDAWENEDAPHGIIKLPAQFFDSLTEYAVPLDPRALAGLKHSALALDLYTWLAHRLTRVKRITGDRVSWAGLSDQFGQEYADMHNFKRKMLKALAQVCEVYPDAKITTVRGGLLLEQSRPPMPKTFMGQAKPNGT